MSSYVSNLQLADLERREKRQYAETIRQAAGNTTVAVVRITHHRTAAGTTFHNAQAWTYNYQPVVMDTAQQQAVVRLLLGRRPDIDWTVGHEYHLDQFMLRRTPEPGQIGHDPARDRRFGGKDPVFLPHALTTRRTEKP